MTRHVLERLAAGKRSPGLFIVPQQSPIGAIVESLLTSLTARPPAPGGHRLLPSVGRAVRHQHSHSFDLVNFSAAYLEDFARQ